MNMQDSSVSTDLVRPDAITQGPFSRAQNIFLFFGGGDRGQIVDALARSVGSHDNQLLTVHGEPGSGKTMTSLVLADRMKHRRNIIRYDHESIGIAALLRHLLIEIAPRHADIVVTPEAAEAPCEPSTDLALQKLWQALQSPLPNNKPFLLIIDSDGRLDGPAQALLSQLAALRYQGRSTIQIVLFERSLENRPMINLERPGYEYWLRRLTLPEIGEFLHHQMLCFDFSQRGLFTRELAYLLAERSEGVVGRINDLARHAMLFADLGSADSHRTMMSQMLAAGKSGHDTDSEPRQKFFSRYRGGLIALLGVGVVLSIAAAIAYLG